MSVLSTRFSQRWYPATHPLLDMPDNLRHWLLSSGSLTQQLTQFAHGQFHVEPFKQQYQRIFLHESQLLGIHPTARAWVREVYLYGDQPKPWVKARSIIPVSTLNGKGRQLKYLGSRSLGSVLFGRYTPQCERQIARLPEGWARRSLYVWHGQPLIVQEVFLTEFSQVLHERSLIEQALFETSLNQREHV